MKARRKVGIPYTAPQHQCFRDLWLLVHDVWGTRVMLEEDPQWFYAEYSRLKAQCVAELNKLKEINHAH
jgi:hypothetical protein